jgi:hypothetical protein
MSPLRTRPGRLKSPYVFPNATGERPLDACNFVRRFFVPALTTGKVEGSLAMTLLYSHLSPAHQLDAVQRLNAAPTATATATDAPVENRPTADGAEVIDFPEGTSGGAQNRTADLGIMSRAIA